ncbi:preprotein translocase subunit YajC [Planctomycetales bacterium]|nr:preprotein translocase subunit YajC [Planctomycetales bacterium]
MFDTLILFAQEAASANPAPAQQGGSGFDMLIFMLPLLLIFYWFFMLRPQQKREDQHRKTIESLDKNDKVMTVGGIIGFVHTVDKEQNEIVLKVDDANNTKIRFNLTAIATVFPKDNEKTTTK